MELFPYIFYTRPTNLIGIHYFFCFIVENKKGSKQGVLGFVGRSKK